VDPVIDYAFQYSGEGHDRIVAAVGNTVYGMTSSMGLGAASRRRDTDLFWRTRGPHGVTTTYWGGSGDDTLAWWRKGCWRDLRTHAIYPARRASRGSLAGFRGR
jgi:Ca2+-binding RTX toxin-like protein